MNMPIDRNRKEFRRQLFFSLGGIAIGIIVAGLIALLINNVIEPTMQVETQDLVQFQGETFSIWYHVDSPHMDTRTQLLQELEEDLSDLLARLDVSIEDIPLPIDVLVHDSPEMMQQTTLRRKSGRAMYSFYSVIDLLVDEDPYARLTELVLAFGWGKCSSQLLYKGMLMHITFPERDFHVPLAAAPVRLLYSLDDLFKLESIGQFQETLYQQYQSPFSARLAMGTFEGIGEFRAMLSTIGDESADYSIADLQVASLVQYLIDCGGGLEGFRAIWGPGTTEALIAQLSCGPLTDLFDAWLTAIQSADTTAPEYEYYRARFLLEAGDTVAAAKATALWNPRDLSISESLLAVRTQLAVGDFTAASEFARHSDSTSTETLQEWVSAYDGWGQAAAGPVAVLAKEDDALLKAHLDEVESAYHTAVDALELSESDLPRHITVFYYESEAARERGAATIPVSDVNRTVWHMGPQDNMVETFVITLLSFVTKKETASNLLQTGLGASVTTDKDELISRGCDMVHAGEWTPLWRVGFGGLPDQLFEVQTGLMISFISDTYGMGVIPDLWVATARIGGGVSLDTAIRDVLGTSRTDIEQALLDSVLICE